ncbi:MAG: O-antigen ligase family protein [Candidatus Korobacteraceae bacterium]|jgi:O-antigen ligase
MILFYLLILSLPMVDHPFFARAIFGITVEKYLGVGCFFLSLCYLPNRKSFPQFLATGQARAFILFAVMAVTSYVFTVTSFDWHEMVGTIFVELVFFIATSIFIDSRQRLENSVLVLIASVGLASLYLIREWAGALSTYGFGYRPGSVAGDPNVFSASAVTVLPIMLAVGLGQHGWKRAFCLGCLLVTIVAILLASSRGAFIALVALLILQMRDVRHRGKFVVIALVIVALFLISPVSPLDRLLHPTHSDTESSDARLQLWSIAVRIVADHPILGVGLWQFAPYMRKYMPPGVDLEFNVPHNTYLEVAVELGFVGLALFLAMLFFTLLNLSRIRRAARKRGDTFMYSLSTAIGNGLVGFMVAAFFVSTMHARVFWFSIFLSTCMPNFLAKASVKRAGSGEDLETRAGVDEHTRTTAAER